MRTRRLLPRFLLLLLTFGAAQGSSGVLPLAVPSETESTGVRTLYLIRHGDYDHEDDRDPDVGKALVPLGVDGVIGTNSWWALEHPTGPEQSLGVPELVPEGLSDDRIRLLEVYQKI